MLARLRRAADAADVGEIAAAAHALKGSAGLFTQGETYERARALEMRARSGDGSDARIACDEIDESASRLLTELRNVRETLQRDARL
jgi:HPt (histidine-containing phosphotransfer) domain-containing protein